MVQRDEVIQSFNRSKVVAVLRGEEQEVLETARAAVKGGMKHIEVTTTVQNSLSVIKQLKEEQEKNGVYIGAGTIMDATSAVDAIHAGADFIVSPHLDETIIQSCHRLGKLIIPGAFTLTEMVKAMTAGCGIVKLFPASAVSPSYIKDVKGPVPHIKMMPTGGIDETNIKAWIDAGAIAVGVGSNLKKAGGDAFDKDKIAKYAEELVEKASGKG